MSKIIAKRYLPSENSILSSALSIHMRACTVCALQSICLRSITYTTRHKVLRSIRYYRRMCSMYGSRTSFCKLYKLITITEYALCKRMLARNENMFFFFPSRCNTKSRMLSSHLNFCFFFLSSLELHRRKKKTKESERARIKKKTV